MIIVLTSIIFLWFNGLTLDQFSGYCLGVRQIKQRSQMKILLATIITQGKEEILVDNFIRRTELSESAFLAWAVREVQASHKDAVFTGVSVSDISSLDELEI